MARGSNRRGLPWQSIKKSKWPSTPDKIRSSCARLRTSQRLFLLAIIVPMIYIVIASFMDPVTLQNKGISFDFSKLDHGCHQRVVSDKGRSGSASRTRNPLLSHLHHHLGSCDDALPLIPCRAGLQGKRSSSIFVITMFFSGGLDPHLPAHQQSGSAAVPCGRCHSAGSIQH